MDMEILVKLKEEIEEMNKQVEAQEAKITLLEMILDPKHGRKESCAQPDSEVPPRQNGTRNGQRDNNDDTDTCSMDGPPQSAST